ncbi:hypothetical protein HAX54_018598 [Datura stramonium]|uniref:Pentatricopeptide repeat-containing protein n=1 Tax=Datura stramonium TaxID=4076 RepID=A0ABS8UMK0_DATST|nr:hypothetical protein [Datura stramonium]
MGFPGVDLCLFKEFIDYDFHEMSGTSHIDTFVLATALGACDDTRVVDLGKQIHARIVVDEVENPDNFSLSALISAYSNCGRMDDARKIFNLITDPCIVLWNSMIAGYKCQKHYCFLRRCTVLNLDCSLTLSLLVLSLTYTLNVDVLVKLPKIEDARQLFESMPYKSLISGNSMIIGLSQNGCPIEALDLFYRINMMEFRMDKFSFSSVISACASS